jgi:hypothetical protein
VRTFRASLVAIPFFGLAVAVWLLSAIIGLAK